MKLLNFDALVEAAQQLPEEGAPVEFGRWVNGRVMAVLASPELDNALHLASGLTILPAAKSTPWHDHEAEEVAVIVTGAGEIEMDGVVIPVRAGDVVLTPPNVAHQTRASADGALAVFWLYSPPGSEIRWFDENPKETK